MVFGIAMGAQLARRAKYGSRQPDESGKMACFGEFREVLRLSPPQDIVGKWAQIARLGEKVALVG